MDKENIEPTEAMFGTEGELNDNDGLPKEGAEIAQGAEALQQEKELDRETARFRANAFDRASTSLVTIGVFTPLVSLLYRSTLLAFMQTQELAMAVIGCLLVAYLLHSTGRGILEMGYRP
ncbi:hypothetical protein NKI38_04510 [Mesorhizobium sp. M0621]|uniref:hypothetical protein n=1 Tax=Mesorhizobium sp. M0621 TaxID=2956974 RepID=UPI0033353C35